MPRYKIEFQREWREVETVERVIEADSDDHAAELGAAMANEFDMNCPDDTSCSKDGYASDWSVENVEETDEELSEDA